MNLLDHLRALLGMGPRARKVPILGVEGCGKSSFLVTLGQYVSVNSYGHIEDESQGYFGELAASTARGEPNPATMRYEPVRVRLRRIPDRAGGFRDVNVVLSSEDIPGAHFRELVSEIRRDPALASGSDLLNRFSELLRASDGLIFVVDVVRDTPAERFRADPETHCGRAFAEQIGPIATGLLLAAQRNPSLARKPIFFVFSKRDLHGLDPSELDAAFASYLAIPLSNLAARQASVRRYDVQCARWSMRGDLRGLGLEALISDLMHGLDAVER